MVLEGLVAAVKLGDAGETSLRAPRALVRQESLAWLVN